MPAKDYFTCNVKHSLQGLEFNLQSEQIEAVMRLVSNGNIHRGDPEHWNGAPHYRLEMGANGIPTCFPGFSSGRFDLWGARELMLSREPSLNLSPLLAVGLKDGVKLTMNTVISSKQLDRYLDGLKSAVRQFYIDFLKESERNIRITTEEF